MDAGLARDKNSLQLEFQFKRNVRDYTPENFASIKFTFFYLCGIIFYLSINT